MYDKSKKTWSQRLKIHKNEKSQLSTNGAASVTSTTATTLVPSPPTGTSTQAATTTPSSSALHLEAVCNGHVAHNVSIRSGIPAQYQITPTAIMHLPLSDYHGGGGAAYDYMSGRSMKYAESWIYGTVRGIPARPAAGLYHPAYAAYAGHPHAAAIFAPTELPTTTAAVAVVLCSCPEYLSGTKGRTVKKASICKKCKGTRLPLANIGGTVRVQSNIQGTKLRPVGASATVRVVSSTKKQRPTILDPQRDPYDLMRRTRLLSPETGGLAKASSSGGSKDKSRNRGKSASPVRGRSRTRHHLKASVSTAANASKALENLDDSWLTEGEDLAQSQSSSSSHSRKSILRCNVNPYDLISINAQNAVGSTGESYAAATTLATGSATPSSSSNSSHESSKKSKRKQKMHFSQNEFMPPNDDFNVQDAALIDDEPPFLRQNKHKVESPKMEAPKRGVESQTPTTPQSSKNKKSNYANVQAIAGQRISLGEKQQTPKSLLKQSADGISTYESISVESPPLKPEETENSNKAVRPDSLQVSQTPAATTEPKRPPRTNKQQQHQHHGEMKEIKSPEDIDDDGEVTVTVTVTPTYNIKSILKRPSSKTSDNGDTTQTDSHSPKCTTPSTPKQKSEGESKAGTPTNTRRQQGSSSNSSPTANSQFYIPMPQARKKVQFLVEENVETETDDCDNNLDSDDEDSSGNSNAGEIKTNYEYYTRKRHQKKQQIQEDQRAYDEDCSDSEEVITYDEQFIQAMLLEKLQLDSEMVTKQQQQQHQHNRTTLHIKEEEDKEDAMQVNPENNFKTDYEDVFSENGKQNSNSTLDTTQPQRPTAADASTTMTTTKVPINQQAHQENPNTNRQSTATKGSFETAISPNRPQSQSSLPMQSVTDMKGKPDDSTDEDFPAKDKNIPTLIDGGDNDDKGLAADDDDDGKDNSVVSHDGHGGIDDGYAAAKYNSTSSSSTDIDATVAALCHTKQTDDNNHYDDDDGDDGSVNVSSPSPASKAQQYGATKSTTTTPTAGVYDDEVGAALGSANTKGDDVKSKQKSIQQQQSELLKCNKKKMKKDMQAIPETTDSRRSSTAAAAAGKGTDCGGGVGVGGRKLTKETQSRNPIRRSQSERQPSSMTYLSNKNDSSSSKNNNIWNNTFQSDAGDDDDGNHGHSNSKDLKLSANIKPNISNCLKDNAVSLAVANKINGSGKGSNNNRNNNGELNFQDTMALRKRSNRTDTRDLFTMALIGRPRDPPPPPPPVATALQLNELMPKAAHLEKASEVMAATEADAIESSQQTVNGLESKPQKTTIGQQTTATTANSTTAAGVTTLNQEINDNTSSDVNDKKQQQQQLVHSKRATTTNNINTQPQETNGRISLATTPMASVTTVNQFTPPSSSNNNSKQQHQRTVVRVAPFNKNPNSFDVHRLKITHTDSDNDLLLTPTTPKTPSTPGSSYSSHYSVTDLSTLNSSLDYGQKKTSILISGDDCYSTMNLSCDDSSTPHYQSSVVVTDGPSQEMEGVKVTNAFNTVTINVSSPRSSEDELIQQHNQLNNLLKRQAKSASSMGSIRAIIPIRGTIDIHLQRSASSTSSTSTSSMTSTCSSTSSSTGCTSKRGKTLIRLDYDKETSMNVATPSPTDGEKSLQDSEWLPHETELLKILRNPVEAVKRNLVPHICKLREDDTQKDAKRSKKMKEGPKDMPSDLQKSSLALTASTRSPLIQKSLDSNSFIGKLLEDPMLNQLAEGLESETVAELIENSLKRLQESRHSLDMTGTKDNDDMSRLIDLSLKRIQEERLANKDDNPPIIANNSSGTSTATNGNLLAVPTITAATTKDEERLSNRGSISSANSFASAHNYELFDFEANESDCYQSCSSEINSMLDDDVGSPETKSKFYQMLVDATLQEIELSTNTEDLIPDEHQYESIRHNIDPIYEEISDVPPPLPLSAPPLNDPELEKKSARSIFEGASKYDILSYLVDAKERGVVKEEVFDYPLNCSNPIIIEEESTDTLSDLGKLSKLKRLDTISSRSSVVSDSSEDNQSSMSSLSPPGGNNFMILRHKQTSSDIERNDSGVGSETSKTSRSKFLHPSHNSSITSSFSSTTSSSHSPQPRNSPLHLCEDCDGAVETQIGEDGLMFAPLVCRKCGKKRVERKEIITEIVETEEKYGRDLQIILEEFCHPMLVAGLLTQEQLSAIFLNTEELLENNQTLAERMRDALDIALEQGDDDLLTVNIGKIFLESTQMLHAFESYCVRQAGASLLLANLEKDKELLRIFLKVSQMENVVLRRMNLNSFLMVPVQRVTKYPLLLARLYKVTPLHLEGRDQLKQAQEKIELHLNHINQEAKDVPTKLWRRISSSSPNRRASCEIDMINIKLRKMAIDVLEWNHDEVRFVMEGKLLYTQPTDSNWKKARTIKLTSVNALLVTNGKPSTNYKAEKVMSDKLSFPKHTGIREASLLMVKEKCGRYALIREPLYLDRCVVCSEADWDEYFEIQEISSKDTFIFKAEDNARTKQWYTQLQYHAQGMGAWRKRRNALANIMINGMLTRS